MTEHQHQWVPVGTLDYEGTPRDARDTRPIPSGHRTPGWSANIDVGCFASRGIIHACGCGEYRIIAIRPDEFAARLVDGVP